jgi:uncharacterized protein YkwD/predicted DNA-binding antitoxin AbrB/MazE fold protein
MRKIIFILSLFLLPMTALAYSDVGSDYDYKTAVDTITEQGIVSGYPDGTFKPLNRINRAEFTKIIVGAKLGENPTDSATDCFPDVSADQWFASYVCYAKNEGIVSGYPDGMFKPADTINLVEAAKIVVNALNVPTEAPEGGEWYSEFIEALANQKVIPPTFAYLSQKVTRGDMAEMIWRILSKKSDQPSVSVAALQNPCYPLGDELPANVDMNRVRATWLQWYNEARAEEGRGPLVYNAHLHRTANIWSQEAVRRGEITHQRDPGDSYYDYGKITKWFKDLGLVFKNVSGVTHTENIAWEYYNCPASQNDCTDHMIPQARKAFDFYMSEKGQAYDAHYRSIMQPNFKEVGLGIAIDRSANRYYLTVHYGTEIVSDPWPICE